VPSNAPDNIYGTIIAQSSIHGAMTGYIQVDLSMEDNYLSFYVSSLSMIFVSSERYLLLRNLKKLHEYLSHFVNSYRSLFSIKHHRIVRVCSSLHTHSHE